MFKSALVQAAADYGLILNERQLQQFEQYYYLLIDWNQKMNLTAITQPQEVAIKHMVDSLSCYHPEFFPLAAQVIDVGTGAGFPGLPLKIFRPDLQLTLLDSLQKRVQFLGQVAAALELNQVQLIHARAEEGGQNPQLREKFDVAVSRAVARLPLLAEYCLPFVRVNGVFLSLKGAQYQQEWQDAAEAIRLLGGEAEKICPVTLPGLADIRAVLVIRKKKATAKQYPRKAGLPGKNPL